MPTYRPELHLSYAQIRVIARAIDRPAFSKRRWVSEHLRYRARTFLEAASQLPTRAQRIAELREITEGQGWA
jgi:hypothetical protein